MLPFVRLSFPATLFPQALEKSNKISKKETAQNSSIAGEHRSTLSGGRLWLFEALNEARLAAREAGVDDKASGQSPAFRVFVHLEVTSLTGGQLMEMTQNWGVALFVALLFLRFFFTGTDAEQLTTHPSLLMESGLLGEDFQGGPAVWILVEWPLEAEFFVQQVTPNLFHDSLHLLRQSQKFMP